ncbi:MAG: FkbM family methyltransferase, partial [Kiritimatiellia bacterium]|nr:FkbM family methyltransferase [Kiritimatiellia bacterium]
VLRPGYDQVGSFNRAQVEKHEHGLFPGLGKFLASIEVPCVTLPDLLAQHAVSRVDVYLVDTEGYDARIVEQIDLVTQPPRVIIYEHEHLSSHDKEKCETRIRTAGFDVCESGGNTVAIRRNGLSAS